MQTNTRRADLHFFVRKAKLPESLAEDLVFLSVINGVHFAGVALHGRPGSEVMSKRDEVLAVLRAVDLTRVALYRVPTVPAPRST
jgi:hypothetical protein